METESSNISFLYISIQKSNELLEISFSVCLFVTFNISIKNVLKIFRYWSVTTLSKSFTALPNTWCLWHLTQL